WLEKLATLGVQIHYEHRFINFTVDTVTVQYEGEDKVLPYSHLILAMGGGSWQKTGSDATWQTLLAQKDITLTPLSPANSGYNTTHDYTPLEGQVLKNTAVKFGDVSKKGEIVLTNYGVEGS